MAGNGPNHHQRLVIHTSGSRGDLIMIYLYNFTTYGEVAAEGYLRFLEAKLQSIANDPRIGSTVEDFPGVFAFLVRVRPRRGKHGHRVFYKRTDSGIEVIRILHTAMNWSEHLPE